MSNASASKEPLHKSGHSTTITQTIDHQFLCPECGKTFAISDAAEAHLHSVHLEHLRKAHKEFHGKDVVGRHVE